MSWSQYDENQLALWTHRNGSGLLSYREAVRTVAFQIPRTAESLRSKFRQFNFEQILSRALASGLPEPPPQSYDQPTRR